MDSPRAPIVAVVDDDEDLRHALGNLLGSLDLAVADFASAAEFLRRRPAAPLPA